MNKRGISPLIATVLLIGFSVMMAALVSNYIIKQTKEFDIEKMIGSDELCSEVSFQIVPSSDQERINCVNVDDSVGICSEGPVKKLKSASLKNKGSFSIWKLTVNSESVGSYEFGADENTPLVTPSGENKIISIDNKISFCDNGKVNIVPHIKDEEGNFVECPSRTVTLIPSHDFCDAAGGGDDE